MHVVKSLANFCRCELKLRKGHLRAPMQLLELKAFSSEYFCVSAADNEQSNTLIGFYSFTLLNLKAAPELFLCLPRLHLN